MNLIVLLALFLLFFGFIVFVLLFGQSPSLRHGIIGKLNYLLIEELPKGINWFLLCIIGQSNMNRLNKGWAYCCESRNPFLQVFFVSLSSSSIVSFLYNAIPHMPGPYLHSIHMYIIIPIQIISLYASYYVACTSNPGIITKENIEGHLKYYKYDGLIYKPKTCVTCKLQKPARSKHCSMCKACIGRLDHHCAWINQCVGENNQRYFFLFLFILTEFCAYGAYLCFQVYRGMIIEWGLNTAYVQDRVTGQQRLITFRKAFLYVLHRDRIIGSIGILALVVSVVVLIFFLYQLYLAGIGITTNEAFKWEMVEDSIDRGELYRKSVIKVNNVKSQTTANYSLRYNKQRSNQEEEEEAIIEEKRIESLDEVDNIYDKGFFGNLKEVFFPPGFLIG
ncbi:DHHC palmitoyltransferase-domain-containing protein [Cokeromyces recurvatus]|uniref:DHHC palmitoyltransferase-domain-containing protein n=1 Tax=Cokeromyces recurvatus TaxID=90255 RepID=UPI00221E7A4C|nr:DHHC palmitoyltransferase-domain-containing protein [Cokeromyces recurvatus]KAI7904871.1 DHHC palmitoyltransferase-domain-containing protein [Cokeromyces recurvatus]